MLNQARRILHLPDWRIQRTWNGYYTQSKSQEVFQHSPDPRIHLVTGIGGKGIAQQLYGQPTEAEFLQELNKCRCYHTEARRNFLEQ